MDKIINLPMNILKLLDKQTVITTSEVASLFKVSWNTAEKALLELTIDGKIRRIKKAGVNLWLKIK